MDNLDALVGRDELLDAFRARLRAGTPKGVALVSAPRLGATHLAHHLLATAADCGWETRALRGHPGMTDLPFGALAPLLPDELELRDDLKGLRVARSALSALAGDPGLVLLIDDAHHLDDLSAALVAQLAPSPVLPLLVLPSEETLPAGVQALVRDTAISRHDLVPLSPAAIRRVIAEAAGGPVTPPVVRSIERQAAGSPVVATRLTRAAIADGALVHSRGVWRLAGELPMPPDVAEPVLERLATLADEERHVLELLALDGPLGYQLVEPFTSPVALERLASEQLVDVVQDGRRRELVLTDQLVDEVVRRGLGAPRRIELACELRERLEATGARRTGDPVTASVLALDGGDALDPDEALTCARRARTLGRLQDAVRLAAVTVAARPRDLGAACTLAEILMLEGRGREVENLLARLGPVKDEDVALVAMTRAGNLFHYLEDTAGALAVLAQARDQLAETPWAAELHGLSAVFELFMGHAHRSLEMTLPHVEHADGRSLVEAITAAAPALAVIGRVEEAAALAQRGFEQRLALGDQPSLSDPGIHLVARSMALSDAGRIEEAIDLAQAVHAGAEAEGLRDGMLWADIVLGRALLDAGRLADAADAFGEGLTLATDLGLALHRRWALSGLLLALSMSGQLDAARLAAEELSTAAVPVARLMAPEATRAQAWALVATGDLPGGRELLVAAAAEASSSDQHTIEAIALHDLVRVGSTEAQVQLLEVLAGVEGPLARAREQHAHAIAADDDEALAEASKAFAATGAELMAAEAAMQASASARRQGRRGSATAHLQVAERLLTRCQGAATPALARTSGLELLTERERQVAELAGSGSPSKRIAAELDVSVRTVDNLLQRAYRKLGVHGREELAEVLRPWTGLRRPSPDVPR